MFEQILIQFGALVGFAAFVSVLVNVLKYFNVVKDGTADKWVASFNFAGVIALFVTRLLMPEWDVAPVDNVLGQAAIVGTYILSYITTILGSKLTYVATKGLPIIGASNTRAEG